MRPPATPAGRDEVMVRNAAPIEGGNEAVCYAVDGFDTFSVVRHDIELNKIEEDGKKEDVEDHYATVKGDLPKDWSVGNRAGAELS